MKMKDQSQMELSEEELPKLIEDKGLSVAYVIIPGGEAEVRLFRKIKLENVIVENIFVMTGVEYTIGVDGINE